MSFMQTETARRADHTDAAVGQRIRSRRLDRRLSQSELADRIGVTFQQVQKYEKGVNRVAAGRLQHISTALGVPASFFFGDQGASTESGESVFAFMQTSGSVRLAKAFHRIKNDKARRLLVGLAEEMAGEE